MGFHWVHSPTQMGRKQGLRATEQAKSAFIHTFLESAWTSYLSIKNITLILGLIVKMRLGTNPVILYYLKVTEA